MTAAPALTLPVPVSFEFYPPNTDAGAEKLKTVVQELGVTRPEFFSVTYGAGGSTRDRTLATVLDIAALGAAMPAAGFDVIVADLSFIPLTTVLPALPPLLAPGGQLLALVKPQFELQPKDIGKGGLVKSARSYAEVEAKLREACRALGLAVTDYFASAVTGGDGNREFFIWLNK